MARLFIPGPTDVHPQVLAAQTQPMMGHRGAEFVKLYSQLQEKLRQVFCTKSRVYVSTSSGTGLQEAAIRNCVENKVLCCVNGAFAQRWYEIALCNGKEAIPLEVEWGKAVMPELVEAALSQGGFEAVALVHNETSAGAVSPVLEIADLVRRRFPEVLLLVDAVSSLGGVALDFDGWGLDVLLTSSQKCLAAPPGLSLAAVSDRALGKAQTVPHRGWYFDFVEWEKNMVLHQTSTTPAISLFFALDAALDRILDEGLQPRFLRHAKMADKVRSWAQEKFDLFAQAGHRSQTLTCVSNTRLVDVKALNVYLKSKGMQISDGYGPLKGRTFRIAHMGEITMSDIEECLLQINTFLGESATCTRS